MMKKLKKIISFLMIQLLILNCIASTAQNNKPENNSVCLEFSFMKTSLKNCIAPKTNLFEGGLDVTNKEGFNGVFFRIKNFILKNPFFKTQISDYFLPIIVSLYSFSSVLPNGTSEKHKSFLLYANYAVYNKIKISETIPEETLLTKIKKAWNNNYIVMQIIKHYWPHYTALVLTGFVILRFQSLYLKGEWWQSMDPLTWVILFVNMAYSILTFLFGDYLAQKIDRNNLETYRDFLRIKVMGWVGFISKIPYFLYLGLFMPYAMMWLKNNINLNESFDPVIRFFIHQVIWLYPYNAFRYYIRDFLYLIADNSKEFKKYVRDNIIEFIKKPFKIDKLLDILDESVRIFYLVSISSYLKLKKQLKPVNYWDIFSPLTVQYIGHTIFIGPTMLAIFLMAGDHAFVLSSIITVYHVIIISHLMFLKKEQKIPDLFKDEDFIKWLEINKDNKSIMTAWNHLRLFIVAKDLSLHHKKTEKIIKKGLQLLVPGKISDNYQPLLSSYEDAFNRVEFLYNQDRKIQAAA